jgi:hypothetical protein
MEYCCTLPQETTSVVPREARTTAEAVVGAAALAVGGIAPRDAPTNNAKTATRASSFMGPLLLEAGPQLTL